MPMGKTPPKPNAGKSGKPSLDSYARYSGLAFQMMAIIGLGAFGGVKLDKWLDPGFPVFTLTLSLVSVFAAIYFAVKGLGGK